MLCACALVNNNLQVSGISHKCRLKITWLEVVDEDMLLLGLDRGRPVLGPCVWENARTGL